MKLAVRVKRLLTGSVGNLIRDLEDKAPEAVVSQAIEEIDDAKEEVRHKLGKVEAERYLTLAQLKRVKKSLEDLGEQIDVALTQERDDLAEAAVEKQIDYESQIPILEESLKRDQESITELDNYIGALESKKHDMRLELKEMREAKKIADKDLEVKVEAAENAFADITSRISDTADMDQSKKLNELEDLTRKNRVQERLAKIKASRGE